jgi:hypothetical protein
MTWSSKRKLKYFLETSIVVVGLLYVVIHPYFVENPMCTDNKQNGTETGVDCGGTCQKMCMGDAKDITVLWARSFEVLPGVYHSVAYIENQNVDSGLKKVPYTFKLYDENNKLIVSREGSTFVSPNGRSAIFEESLHTGGNRIPKFTRFEFGTPETFYKTPALYKDIQIVEADKNLTDLDTSPKVSATLKNGTFIDIGEFEVVAIVYDQFDNAIASSKTIVDQLPKQSSTEVFFSWPTPFSADARKVEIVPMIDAFNINP